MRANALLVSLLILCGCDLGLDPDSLVRDLRLLGGRMGPPGGVAEIEPQGSELQLSLLLAAPSGPGRRVPSPRRIDVDWYLCLTPRSVLAQGAVDPACGEFDAAGPVQKPGERPALLHLAGGEAATVPLGPLRERLIRELAPLFSGGGMMGGGMLPRVLQLPLVAWARAVPATGDRRDSEVGFLFGRLRPMPGAAPNRNPELLPLRYSIMEDDPEPKELMPCGADGRCTPLRVSRQQQVWLTGGARPGSAEMYVPDDESGQASRTEVLRFSWFSTDGEFSEERTGEKKPQTRWKNEGDFAAPPEVKTVTLWLVLQDDRGGAAWDRYEFAFDD
jgi:hypothetical protein